MKLLFDYRTKGHHIEYLHHLYMMMVENKKENYMIVVPEDFNERGKEYNWPESENVKFDFIPIEQSEKLENAFFLKNAIRKTSLLKMYIRKYRPTDVFLISLIGFMPLLPLMISNKVHIVGIIYKIYLYEWKRYSLIRKCQEIFKYKLITRNNCITTVFILNDKPAAVLLNRLYNTSKFRYLVDPYNFTDYVPRNILKALNVPTGNKVFLHFGSMNRRKGSLKILKALSLIPKEKKENLTVIVAGIIQNDIRKEFYELLEDVKKTSQILVYDEFCSTEFIEDLCESCNFILLPYGVTAQSSGLIAYSAYFRKPVIGPSQGLLGKLIRRYNLGIQLDEMSPQIIAETMVNVIPYSTKSNYSNESTIGHFVDQINKYF